MERCPSLLVCFTKRPRRDSLRRSTDLLAVDLQKPQIRRATGTTAL